MINLVNEAINRKLASISFTTIVNGIVTNISPLQIKLNDRITIGLDFIEPKSLGIDDNSPDPALSFIVGDKVQMIRYNNGQRFYVLGAATGFSGSYADLSNKPKLNTNNSNSQTAEGAEEINGVINLHKIAKTGRYSDLIDKPTIPAAQINSDWNATTGIAKILNKPTLASVATSGSYNDLSNKPTIPAAPVQSDWNITSTSSLAFIKNKPAILEFEEVDSWS